MTTISDLIGYDVRRAISSSLRGLWGAKRREGYLLRPEIDYPYSVDRIVWPSRFQLGPMNPYPFPQPPDTIVIDPATADPHFQLFDLWDDLVKMLGPYRPSAEGDFGVAIGLVRPDRYPSGKGPVQDEWWRAIHGSPATPSAPESGWRMIGYDVANSGYTSALSNCGFVGDEKVRLRKTWSRSINQSGLFDSVDDAAAFCADANVRIAEDGPFFVFELFLTWATPPTA